MIDLATWNLTIPVGVPAAVIDTPILAGGYQDDYFQSRDGRIFFWAPASGSTTSNSVYPRSELRETYADGSLRNWPYSAANNMLSATARITQVPGSGMLAFSQIHSKQNTSPPLMLGYQYSPQSGYGNVVIAFRGHPADADSTKIVLSNKIRLDQDFSYEIHLAKNGLLTIGLFEPGGAVKTWSRSLNKAWASHGLYFKAGVYTLDNSGNETNAGAASFSQLKVEHR
ncbi:Alginate lyase [Ectopseudomonas composti]|uniref:Alginate lyase n=1 Tax=Ectopseudomonas composti TaxID=658457 RepID=A0A1I5KAL4_9GAMM|nr:polysaccharide lyase family 7 protein [Pseudomonas composti]SFO82028.1 Alginate lyase [Pseudomonas composti]